MPLEGLPCIVCETRLGRMTASRPKRPIRIDGRCLKCHDQFQGTVTALSLDSKPLEASPCVECGTTGGYTPPIERRGVAANFARRNVVTNTKPDKPKELDPPEDDEIFVAGSVGDSVREYRIAWSRRREGLICPIR